MNEIDKAEESFFNETMAVILFLNKNGMKLDSIREMINAKLDHIFNQYPMVSKKYDQGNKS